ncbi:MAG TPA: ArsA-related P-loop ATPase [Candidatus Binataceae bacterium]|nr:ArsA-related P-loop ATPase [Candidatus Binataceae bacterium]
MTSTGASHGLLAGRLLVCLGPGGVGKTTVSAALALGAAMAGRRVDVMTVDPAPRLLDALGLKAEDAAEPREVELACLAAWSGAADLSGLSDSPDSADLANSSNVVELAAARADGRSGFGARRRPALGAGRLRALRLDPKRTFDAIVARHAPSPAAADAIMQNRIYRNLSQALAGVGDYMAMERLLELSEGPETDLVVLDTPPAREALDFLDAPRRLLDLLNSRAVTLLGGGMRRGFSVVDIAARAVLSAFDRLTGLHLLGDVQAFVRNFDGMFAGFAERAARVQKLLVAGDTAVVVVTTAEPERTAQAHEFIAALRTAGIEPRAVIVNRMLPAMPSAEQVARAALAPALKRKLVRAAREFAALRAREAAAIESLRASGPEEVKLLAVPDLGREPAELADLLRLGHSLAIL